MKYLPEQKHALVLRGVRPGLWYHSSEEDREELQQHQSWKFAPLISQVTRFGKAKIQALIFQHSENRARRKRKHHYSGISVHRMAFRPVIHSCAARSYVSMNYFVNGNFPVPWYLALQTCRGFARNRRAEKGTDSLLSERNFTGSNDQLSYR